MPYDAPCVVPHGASYGAPSGAPWGAPSGKAHGAAVNQIVQLLVYQMVHHMPYGARYVTPCHVSYRMVARGVASFICTFIRKNSQERVGNHLLRSAIRERASH